MRDSRPSGAGGRAGGGDSGRVALATLSVGERLRRGLQRAPLCATGEPGSGGTHPQSHLARGARRHRGRRLAAAGIGRKRAVSPHRAQAFASLTAARRGRARLAPTGDEGLPPLEPAGNVQRPRTALKLSLGLPPLVEGERAARALKELLEGDPPYCACVRFEGEAATGWNAPATAPWLASALERASQALFG